MKHLLAVFALSLLAAVLAPVPASRTGVAGDEAGWEHQGFGDPGGFLNILPPGQKGVLNGAEALAAQLGDYPPHVEDQLHMYGDLVYHTPGLTEAGLMQFFKDASFGVAPGDVERVYSPTDGVVVVRDAGFGVPHIFGETRYATMFAQGYTAAEDRLFLMDVLRHVGRARLSEFLGASPANQQLDREQLAVAPYKDEDFTRQIQEGVAAGPEGELILADLLAYVDGVNQYILEALADPTKMPAEYAALQQAPKPWRPEDTAAIASLVGGIFGKGGGGELTNHCGLKFVEQALGDGAAAREAFGDLHFANDPEAPTTASGAFPYMTELGPVDPAAHPDVDCASLRPIDEGEPSLDALLAAISGTAAVTASLPGTPPGARVVDAPWGSFVLDLGGGMSNALLIGGEHTESGKPIAVFGPQTGYFMPQLLVEKDVHGPGIHARGASFAGADLYIQLGRGRDYAWSATSSGADNVDQWVFKLCEPEGGTPTTGSMGYEHNGVCQPVETFQHTQVAKPSAGGVPEEPDIILSWRVERTQHYGPLVARGTLEDGTPVAIATRRSTYMNELGSAQGFFRVNNPDFMTNGFDSFREAMGTGVHYTFNWFYVDADDIGYQHSCLCPQRAQGVDPYLPAWGTGEWDWQGFIPHSAQPWDLNPAKGYISSWNNKQAPGFMSNDRNFSYGPAYRSDLLDVRLEQLVQAGGVDRADMVRTMEEAGTVDLRGQELTPLLLQALGPEAPPGADPRTQEMRDRLAAWADAGFHRRDLDRDGEYDDPQPPAIIDAWWPRLSHAMFDAASGNAIDALGIALDEDNRRLHRGSAFNGGFFSHVNKDLRQVLGLPVTAPWSRTYCGGGDLGACRAALWESLEQAAADLEAEFGSPRVGDWKRDMSYEDVRHQPVGVTSVPAIHWINRPTFQQVVQVGERITVARSFGAGALGAAGGGRIQFVYNVRAFGDGTAEGRFRLMDRAGAVIEIDGITGAAWPAGEGCGAVPAGGPDTFEFRGTAAFNGAGAHEVSVCVQDNGDPGRGADLLHAECPRCPYTTATAASSAVLETGNLKVRVSGVSGEGGAGQASVIMLEPATGATAKDGALVPISAVVYDSEGEPLPAVEVTLTGVAALGPLSDLLAVTDSLGGATFLVPAVEAEWTAASGTAASNAVLVRLE
jgi:acyl-homoserine lactone acylase PvdQ